MSFSAYEHYKDTGLDWLPKVPAHWYVTPLKYVASLKGRLGWQGLRADEYTEEGPFLVTSEHFRHEKIDWEQCYHVTPERYAQAPEIQLRRDDLLMMKDGAAMGKLAYIESLPGLACLNSHLLLFRPMNGRYLNRFLFYVLGGPSFTTYMVQKRTGTTFFGISQENISSFKVALPPVDEQCEIVAFLDRETATVDALIESQRHLIELLREKRHAVTAEVVTKGLPSGSAMKPSNLKWLGSVPVHWTPQRLGRLFSQQKRQGFTDKEVLSVYRDYGVIPKESRTDNFNKTPEDLSMYQLVNPGDLVVNKMKAWQGSLGISPVEGITSPDYVVFVPHHQEVPEYLHLLLRSQRLVSTYLSISNGIRLAQWRLEPDKFRSLQVFLPPKDEQRAIVAFLQRETSRIDALIAEATNAITLLEERRTALISAVVTGRIDVRGRVSAPQKEASE